jgi:hypothetical protein
MTTSPSFNPLKALHHFRLLTPTHAFLDHLHSRRRKASVLNARLVYSWLSYRSRLHSGSSLRRIHSHLGLHATTIRNALSDLGGLVTKHAGYWHAVAPPEGLFHPRTCSAVRHWSDGYAYSMLFLPAPGALIDHPSRTGRFGLNHAVVWSHIYRNADATPPYRFTVGGVASLYHISETTVRSVLKDLVSIGLIGRVNKGPYSLVSASLSEVAAAKYFRSKFSAPEKPAPSTSSTSIPFTDRNDGWDQCRRLCRNLMTQDVADKLVEIAKQSGDSPSVFGDEFRRVFEIYRTTKKADGKFGGYFLSCYANRLKEAEETARRQRQEARLADPELQKKIWAEREEQERLAAGNPLAPHFSLTDDSIKARVELASTISGHFHRLHTLKCQLGNHIEAHLHRTTPHLDLQSLINRKGDISRTVTCHALAVLNSYYGTDQRASQHEFESALDIGLRQLGITPLFERAAANS